MLIVNSFISLVLEVTNLVKLSLFLNFKQSLLNCFRQKYVKDRLNFTIIIKEIIIFNLSDFIYTGLFGDIWRCGWARNKLISLAFNFRFFRSARFVLLSQEVG
jgi:hypothetical protein